MKNVSVRSLSALSLSRFVDVLVLPALALALFAPAFAVSAQEKGTIRGRVESSITREALSGVLVTLGEGVKQTRTGTDGRFVLTEVPAGKARLSLELRPDFVTTVELVEVFPGDITQVSLAMMPVAILLDELLVKAGAGGTDPGGKSYPEEEVALIAPSRSALDLLAKGFPGVEIRRGSGQVGTSASILIRGASSLTLPSEPLIYLDGIRVGGSSGAEWLNAGDVLGILEMVPAETVERIEVLKGPAATRYGIGANNGVILIWTRKGPGV